MNLPDKIKLGWREIDIEYRDDILYKNNNLAELAIDQYWAAIDTTLAFCAQRNMLFTNIHWIMCSLCELAVSDENMEQIGVMMYTILRDNPALFHIADISGIRELRIAGNIINVELADELNTNGDYDRKYSRMRIKNIVPQTRKPQTLIHEIYHAIFHALCIEKVDSTERDIRMLAWFTTLLLHQNDFSWMLDGDGDE